jgi:hypothetical protein
MPVAERLVHAELNPWGRTRNTAGHQVSRGAEQEPPGPGGSGDDGVGLDLDEEGGIDESPDLDH